MFFLQSSWTMEIWCKLPDNHFTFPGIKTFRQNSQAIRQMNFMMYG